VALKEGIVAECSEARARRGERLTTSATTSSSVLPGKTAKTLDARLVNNKNKQIGYRSGKLQ